MENIFTERKKEFVNGSSNRPGGTIDYLLSQPVLTTGCGMCYPLCRMMDIKDPLLLVESSNP